MSMIRRLIFAALAALSIAPAFGQSAPPPVPALPDTDRVTSYSITGSTCACAVNFALYGDSTDYQNWLTVYINNVQVPYSDPSAGWTITSPTGPLATIPRPITDAVLTFNAAQTGTITIVGARRPRRVSQFAENRGVAARDLNQTVTDLVAQNREIWDLFERTQVYEPNFFPTPLPLAAARAGQFLCWNSSGQPTGCVATTGSTTFQGGAGVVLSGTNPTVISTQQAANSQSINYTIAPTDCQNTVMMSGGLLTVTLPASPLTNGFTNGCEVTVKDNEATRGKKLSGFPSDLSTILWPLQTAKVKVVAGAWVTTQNPGRWKIPSTTEVCIRQDGSASSDGLGNGTVAADCLPTGQTAVTLIGQQWDGSGYNACNMGFYTGGTSTFNETVSMTGQSVGCYLTFYWRGATTHVSTGACFSGGDNGIAIYNMNLGFVPIVQCNTNNAVGTGAFYGHQTVIYDWFGSFEWIPSGANDRLVFMDAQGRGVMSLSGGGLVVGDGNIRAFDDIFHCDAHCAGFQVSGPIGFSPNLTGNRVFALYGGSWINTTASYTGGPVTGITTSISSGNSTLITNGTTIPGGTTTAGTGGAGMVCTSKC